MNLTRERLAQLKSHAQSTFADHRMLVDAQEMESLLALAERALEPQSADFQTWFESYSPAGKGLRETMHDAYSFGRASNVELEPQGQALPSAADALEHIAGVIGGTIWRETPEHVGSLIAKHIRAYASQLALPAGPVPEGFVLVPMHLNAEMRDVLSEEDWTWEDLLVAANAVTEEQYYAIQSGDDGSPAVAQPVADERAEYERMLRAGYQHDNVRRQERGLALSDELTQQQEREIAERVALKFPSDASTSGYPKAGFSKDNPVAFSCAKRTAHPTSGSMTCDTHCGDDVKCLRATIDKPEGERGNA